MFFIRSIESQFHCAFFVDKLFLILLNSYFVDYKNLTYTAQVFIYQ